ncbi:bifunctional 2-polyprenyl-6-hydroxyphenol methylase/3-demethylubiquinol 3-O-methyltransferase UbiG [Geobacter sp. DSM 9736]|uniref:class I SAM-dependent methyltransferase n=1 Tax=Geobacter sp. DSM 9736 TaxID=1277350 RepID=UPI000B5EF62B|nr:class I SAM-dependent methyltransferase [Geobacter sp. DSM 9736]SNB46819.1 Methyltransferase domain-containing protein [Geobacter sp. DSM 9736]
MATVQEHYDNLLADYYSWLFGDYEEKVAGNEAFFAGRGIVARRSGKAIDLGAGSGFQSLALGRLGFSVLSVDTSSTLLRELECRRGDLPVTTILGDMLETVSNLNEPVELCVCMGDTLPHLTSAGQVVNLVEEVFRILAPRGLFVITYRDLSFELDGVDRFIPVKSDPDTIFTCFLEYGEQHVMVHDLVYQRRGGGWDLLKSCYPKLRLPLDPLLGLFTEVGFDIEECGSNGGMVTIICSKPGGETDF